jgi:hypothetical protein
MIQPIDAFPSKYACVSRQFQSVAPVAGAAASRLPKPQWNYLEDNKPA